MSHLNFEFEAEHVNDKEDNLAATERERYVRSIRESVQRDISKLLLSSRSYVNHERGHSSSNMTVTQALSRPRGRMLHRENKLCQDQRLEDHMDYATVKTFQLREQRLKKEVVDAVEIGERQRREQSVKAFKEKRMQLKGEHEHLQRKENEAMRQYGRAISSYLYEKVERDLQGLKEKVKKQGSTALMMKHTS
ncbi:hypothetical protein CEUSTIGMA_g13713.t1 [Chlamydomonas eustigma]|uniref:Uncharacterized protein n=1 Tax=Chlamydomonas eustigma TaxID=1157962 RepID=A0A250XT81_9CHLO|nr:hypothetical protein CEUSTIGMA_g13713.t1 [Chlamydomonas eustigma]|eukprot:GAX86301.1 hypothetical protein CEUSTIGMA_g13713.t1 [Chlamydomonas eustigma]